MLTEETWMRKKKKYPRFVWWPPRGNGHGHGRTKKRKLYANGRGRHYDWELRRNRNAVQKSGYEKLPTPPPPPPPTLSNKRIRWQSKRESPTIMQCKVKEKKAKIKKNKIRTWCVLLDFHWALIKFIRKKDYSNLSLSLSFALVANGRVRTAHENVK